MNRIAFLVFLVPLTLVPVAMPREAQAAATESLHFHGGYGFTLEFDVQLYFRRAKAWSLLLDDPAFEVLHLADCLYGPVEHPSLDVPIDLARR